MITGLWGKKIGMTQVFADDKVVPVTVLDVGRLIVTNKKTQERDGYDAVQIGCVKKRYADKAFSTDWVKQPKKYFSFVREIKVTDELDEQKFAVGNAISCQDILSIGDKVDAFGKTKGCGFAGVVRRWNFAGARASHGSTMGNTTGSLSFFATQGKVIKGKKMPGHMGNKQRVVKNLKVMKVDGNANLIVINGSVPGRPGTLIFIRKS